MLAPENRLRNSEEFELVKKEGKRVSTKNLIFSYLKRDDDNPTRLGLVVTKKVDKRATARNHISRLIREAVRNNIQEIKSGHDIVIVVRSVLTNLSDCENQIREAIEKSNLKK